MIGDWAPLPGLLDALAERQPQDPHALAARAGISVPELLRGINGNGLFRRVAPPAASGHRYWWLALDGFGPARSVAPAFAPPTTPPARPIAEPERPLPGRRRKRNPRALLDALARIGIGTIPQLALEMGMPKTSVYQQLHRNRSLLEVTYSGGLISSIKLRA